MGYQGSRKLKNPKIYQSRMDKQQKSIIQSRQENVNGRLKQFQVLNGVFRHTKDMQRKHKMCFNAVAVITELFFELEEGLYAVEYDVNYD